MPESKVVCSDCHAEVEFIEKEMVWRHKNKPHEDQSGFCQRYGYPVKPLVKK